MLDPNSKIKTAHEVRVTMRGERITENGARVQVSTRSDFIAPEVSPVSTSALEQAKGLRGWTAGEAPAVKRNAESEMRRVRAQHAQHDAERMTCGVAMRKASPATVRVVTAGPSAAHRAERDRIARQRAARRSK